MGTQSDSLSKMIDLENNANICQEVNGKGKRGSRTLWNIAQQC